MNTQTKRCSQCGVVKPWSDFAKARKGKNNVSRPNAFCKPCGVQRVQAWKKRYPERYAALKNGTREQRFQRKCALLGRKPHRCDICGTALAGKHHLGPAYDHNHDTGEGRGWLCPGCNKGLGNFGENVSILYRAIDYLTERGAAVSRPLFL